MASDQMLLGVRNKTGLGKMMKSDLKHIYQKHASNLQHNNGAIEKQAAMFIVLFSSLKLN